MKLPQSVTINGKRWRIVVGTVAGAMGNCHSPEVRHKTITITPAILHTDYQFDLLRVLLHESLHAGCFALDEEMVEATSTDMARLLWRFGYRRNS